MFVYGMTVYVENLKDCMCRKSQGIYRKKKKEKIETLRTESQDSRSTQKSIAFLYTNNKQLRNKMKNSIIFNCGKKMK